MGSRRGFTFVELIIAVTMFSVLFLGLGIHLRGGMTVWRRVTRTGEMRQQHRVTAERLRKDLANAFIYDSREGSSVPVVFGPDVFSWTTITREPQSASGNAALVSYWCGEIEGQTGLWRTRQSIGEAVSGLKAAPELLLPECTSMAMEFAITPEQEGELLQWTPEWDSDGGLPRLMAVVLSGEEGSTRQVFFAPAGAFAVPEDS